MTVKSHLTYFPVSTLIKKETNKTPLVYIYYNLGQDEAKQISAGMLISVTCSKSSQVDKQSQNRAPGKSSKEKTDFIPLCTGGFLLISQIYSSMLSI